MAQNIKHQHRKKQCYCAQVVLHYLPYLLEYGVVWPSLANKESQTITNEMLLQLLLPRASRSNWFINFIMSISVLYFINWAIWIIHRYIVLCTSNLNSHASMIFGMCILAQVGVPVLTWLCPGHAWLHLCKSLDTIQKPYEASSHMPAHWAGIISHKITDNIHVRCSSTDIKCMPEYIEFWSI